MKTSGKEMLEQEWKRQGGHSSQGMRTCLTACARTLVCGRGWRGKGWVEGRDVN